MSLLFMESFDGYGGTGAHATLWSGGLSGMISSSPTPRTGSHAVGGGSGGGSRFVTPATLTLICGFAFYFGGTNQGSFVISGTGGGQVALTLDADGIVRVRLGSVGGSVIGASASVLVASSWNFIEAKILVGNSGTYEVLVNGISVLSGSGDTQQQSSADITSITVGSGNANGIDDLYVLDSDGGYLDDFIGDCKIECLSPSTGNGSNTGLTVSTGADHGALVDELPANDDTDYNSGSAAGVKDTYNYPSLSSTGVVYAVQANARAKKTDSSTKTIAQVTRISGTDYDGDTVPVASTTYGQYSQIWEKRPSDSNDWTVANVNAAEFGLKVVA